MGYTKEQHRQLFVAWRLLAFINKQPPNMRMLAHVLGWEYHVVRRVLLALRRERIAKWSTGKQGVDMIEGPKVD